MWTCPTRGRHFKYTNPIHYCPMMKKSRLWIMAGLFVLSTVFLVACGIDEDFIITREINVISREEGSGTRGAFVELLGIIVTDDTGTRDRTTREADIANGTNLVIGSVAGNHYAIGYISLGALNYRVRALDIDGIAATPDNVLNGIYPLFRSFDIAVREELTPLTQDFIDFILSAEGQYIVTDRGYITADLSATPYTGGGYTGTVVITGSTAVFSVMERLREAYEARNPGVIIEIHMSGSSAGITGAINGTADIGMTSRPLRDTEAEQVQSITIAYDGLAVIVHHDNPVKNLSQEEVRQVFTGELTRWESLVNVHQGGL